VPTEANRSLTQVLPQVLQETREILGERRATFVFDRGGWSPKLFQTLIGEGFDILTYRKGRYKNISRGKFTEHRETIAGREVCYALCDKGAYFLKRKLRLRQVTVLGEDGHQTHIITSRRDLSAAEVAYRMFNRWRQENFFKYLSAEFALDALVDYGIEKADAHREIPNPDRKKINRDVKQAIGEVCRLYAEYGLSADENREGKRPTMRGFKIAHSKKLKEIKEALEHLAKLEAKRKQIPTRIPVGKVVQGPVIKLSVEKKQLTDIFKMVAYQLESDLVKNIAPVYRRSDDEGRTLVQDILSSSADIEVNQDGLYIKYAPLSSPHRTAVLKALCENFTQRKVNYPGTKLRMHFSVKPPPPQGMAFPGAREPR
jgi:hypothetical protein